MSKRKIRNELSSNYFTNLKNLIGWYRNSYVGVHLLPRAGYDRLTEDIDNCDEYENLIGNRYIEKIIENYDQPINRNRKKIEAIYTFLSDLSNGERKSKFKPHIVIPPPELIPLDENDGINDSKHKSPPILETKKSNETLTVKENMMVDLPQPGIHTTESSNNAGKNMQEKPPHSVNLAYDYTEPGELFRHLEEIRNQFSHFKADSLNIVTDVAGVIGSGGQTNLVSNNIKKASDVRLNNCEFIIINKQYNSLLDCWNPGDNIWRVIHWHEWHYHLNQKWIITKIQDTDKAVLFSPKSGLCIEVSDKNNLGGFSLTLGEYCGREDQHWRIEILNDWSFKIASASPSLFNYCIDAYVFSENNKILHLHEWHGGDNQKWFLSPCFIEPGSIVEKRALFNEVRFQDRLERGMEIMVGHCLKSKNGKYKLAMQFDGNLVLYNEDNTSLWSNEKCGEKVKKCIFQHDGNFVCYNTDRPPFTPKKGIWDSGTHNKGAHYVKVDDNGFVGIYSDSDELIWWKPDDA